MRSKVQFYTASLSAWSHFSFSTRQQPEQQDTALRRKRTMIIVVMVHRGNKEEERERVMFKNREKRHKPEETIRFECVWRQQLLVVEDALLPQALRTVLCQHRVSADNDDAPLPLTSYHHYHAFQNQPQRLPAASPCPASRCRCCRCCCRLGVGEYCSWRNETNAGSFVVLAVAIVVRVQNLIGQLLVSNACSNRFVAVVAWWFVLLLRRLVVVFISSS